MRLPDTVLPDGLSAMEVQEAYRALKGHTLRIETYADDGSAAAANPYMVIEQNFTVACLQHIGGNRHAVFQVSPRETVSFHYERGRDDPRVGHDIVLEIDAYGNLLRSVSIGYPRRTGYASPEPALPATSQAMLAYDQARLHVRGSERSYTQRHRRPDQLAGRLQGSAADCRRPGRDHRRCAVGQGNRDHRPVYLRRDRRGRRCLADGVERGT
jgi:hypothetical protein